MRPSDMSADTQAALDRLIAGTAVPSDVDLLTAWADGAPRRRAVLTAFVRSPRPAWPTAETVAAREAVLALLRVRTGHAGPRSSQGSNPSNPSGAREWASPRLSRWASQSSFARARPATAVALVAGAAILVGIFGWSAFSPSRGRDAVAGQTYATTAGERAEIRLRDGTDVVLAPRSSLQVLPGFDAGHRVVSLTGEAYFAVARAEGTPFLVRAGRTTTRVLGTSFVVRHGPREPRVRVAVTSGKVSVSAQGPQHPSLVLTAGLVGDVTDSSAVVVGGANSDDERAWVDGRLVFHYASTAEVLATLSRWYGYDFHLVDSTLAAQHLTIVLNARSADSALTTLKLLLNVDLRFDGSTVTLTPRRAGEPSRRHSARHDVLMPRTPEVGR